MASSYCEVSSNWSTDQSLSSVTTYSFIDEGFDEIQAVENNRCSLEHGIQLRKNEDDEHFVLHLSCPNPAFACVNGISIVSESRTLEISNDTEGYITTVRGKHVVTQEDDDRYSSLYFCKCFFREDYSNLTVKFLSLGDLTSFCIQSVVINIRQCTENKSASTRGTFDINKLKKDINDMGDVSDRAKDLLATMEQFQENKLKHFEGLMMTQSHNSQQPTSPFAQGLSAIMNSILGPGAMGPLRKSHSTSNGSDGDEADMYEMLRTVCGSVSNMRATAKQEQDSLKATMASPDSGIDSTSQSPRKNSEHEEDSHLDIIASMIDQKINQAKSDIKEEFMDFKKEIRDKLDEVTNAMNEKLDAILSKLSDTQNAKDALRESPPKTETLEDS